MHFSGFSFITIIFFLSTRGVTLIKFVARGKQVQPKSVKHHFFGKTSDEGTMRVLQLTLQKDAVIDFYPGHIYTGYMVCIIHGSGRAAKNINRGGEAVERYRLRTEYLGHRGLLGRAACCQQPDL